MKRITEDVIYDLAFAFREPLERALHHAVQDYELRHEICKTLTEALEALIDAKITKALQQPARDFEALDVKEATVGKRKVMR